MKDATIISININNFKVAINDIKDKLDDGIVILNNSTKFIKKSLYRIYKGLGNLWVCE